MSNQKARSDQLRVIELQCLNERQDALNQLRAVVRCRYRIERIDLRPIKVQAGFLGIRFVHIVRAGRLVQIGPT